MEKWKMNIISIFPFLFQKWKNGENGKMDHYFHFFHFEQKWKMKKWKKRRKWKNAKMQKMQKWKNGIGIHFSIYSIFHKHFL